MLKRFIQAFTLANGAEIRLQAALDVDSGANIFATDAEMNSLGVQIFEYYDTNFEA